MKPIISQILIYESEERLSFQLAQSQNNSMDWFETDIITDQDGEPYFHCFECPNAPVYYLSEFDENGESFVYVALTDNRIFHSDSSGMNCTLEELLEVNYFQSHNENKSVSPISDDDVLTLCKLDKGEVYSIFPSILTRIQ